MDWDTVTGREGVKHLKERVFEDQQPYSYWAFLAGVLMGGDIFHLHPVTPLSFMSDDSNFVQNHFGIGSIFWDKKNRDQIDNEVTMTSSLLWWVSKTAKNSLF